MLIAELSIVFGSLLQPIRHRPDLVRRLLMGGARSSPMLVGFARQIVAISFIRQSS
jgi:hypothetical protein